MNLVEALRLVIIAAAALKANIGRSISLNFRLIDSPFDAACLLKWYVMGMIEMPAPATIPSANNCAFSKISIATNEKTAAAENKSILFKSLLNAIIIADKIIRNAKI